MKHIFLGLAVFMVAALAIGGGIFYDATPSNYINGSGVAAGDVDLNGNDLICDADGDTKIDVTGDDAISIYVNNAVDFTIAANTLTCSNGSELKTNVINATTTSSGITIGGTGATSTESLTWKYGETDNICDVSSATGVATVDFGTVNLATDALDLSEGNITNSGDIQTDSLTADGSTINVNIGGSTDYTFGANSFTAVAGSYIYSDNIGDTSGNGITIAEAILGVKQFRHAYPSSLTTAGTTITADLSVSDVVNIDLEGSSGNVTVTVSNANAGESFALIITQGSVARTVTVTGAISPGGGGATYTITTTNNYVDVLTCLAQSNAAFLCSLQQDYR